MLQFKDGRFHAYGISFQLPEGFYLDTAPDLESECGIVAWSPGEDYQVEWDFVEEKEDPPTFFQRFFLPGSGMELLSKIEPCALNNLAGCKVIYCSGKCEYFETRFSVKDNVQLMLLIHTDRHKIKDVLELAEVRAILEDIRID